MTNNERMSVGGCGGGRGRAGGGKIGAGEWVRGLEENA